MSGIVNVIMGCVMYMLEVSANNEKNNTVAVRRSLSTFKLQNKRKRKKIVVGCHTKAPSIIKFWCFMEDGSKCQGDAISLRLKFSYISKE